MKDRLRILFLCTGNSCRCRVIHAGFDDPPKMAEELAKQGASREKQLDCFRKIRDEIKAFVEKMPENIFKE